MAAEGYRKRLRDEGTCSVCLDYCTNPVTLDCGHSFCRVCITQSWKESPMEATCPQCRVIVQTKKLRPNRQLANMAEVAKDLSDLLKRRMVLVEEAVQECKDQIFLSVKILCKERENILVYKAENEQECLDLLVQMEKERAKTAAAFRELRQFVEQQESLLLSQREEVEKEIARRWDEHLARLSGEFSSLDSLIQELEEKQQQPANELQNIGNILERCQMESFKNPGAFAAALKWRIHDFSDRNLFLEASKTEFKDSLESGIPLQEAKVTLAPDTAHRQLVLSEDLKSV